MTISSRAATSLNVANGLPINVAPIEGISIECYENSVPPFVEETLQQLYGNLFSSLSHLRIYGMVENASTFVIRNDGIPTTVWLFRRERNTVRVLNEGITLDGTDVLRFADHVFETYNGIDLIRFHAVRPQMVALHYPSQRFNCLEDMVVALPASVEEYHASLGKSTRTYVKRYLNKAKRDFPSLSYRLVGPAEIDEKHLRRIIHLNRMRMASKGKISINDDETAERIVQLVMDCGAVGLLTIDNKVCAGTINYKVGDNYFLEILAHDLEYNDHRLGTLCCYLTICEMINRGGKEYHLLWGKDPYKTRLLGVQRDLDDLVLYRSRGTMLLNADTVFKNVLAARMRNARTWLHAGQSNNTLPARVVAGLLHGARMAGLIRSA